MAFTVCIPPNILFMTTYVFFNKTEAFTTAFLLSFWALIRITLSGSFIAMQDFSSMHLKIFLALIHYLVLKPIPHFTDLL